MESNAQTQNIHKPSGKFSPLGMLVTLIGGAGAGIIVGLVFYGINMVLPCSIPLVFPFLAGTITGLATERLGSGIGRCRNPLLAVCVAILAGTICWGTEHATDYVRFHVEAYNSIAKDYPQAPAENINLAIEEWLKEETGQSGLAGFMLLKANSSSEEFGFVIGGIGVPLPGTLSGVGLMIYWFIELVITAGAAGFFNRDYAKEPYCDHCNAWRKIRTIIGNDANLEETVEQLQQRNIAGALESLKKTPEGNIVRLQIEFCPGCYDSKFAKLVVVKDTGPKTWMETTVWAEKLEPSHIRQIIALA